MSRSWEDWHDQAAFTTGSMQTEERSRRMMRVTLSNALRPECGQVTISLPIPRGKYDQTIETLQTMDLGFSVNQDCTVNEIDSAYSVLETLKGKLANVDELDYLAKRLDGFCESEASQFNAMAYKLELSYIKEFINLTFCCQRATVITEFSDLEQIGKDHLMTLNDGMMPMDQYQAVDGRKEALQLIQGGGGIVTPYGVVYDNGMELEQTYNGHQFHAYLYDGPVIVLEIVPKRGLAERHDPEYLYLPAAEHQIERTLLRVGITALSDTQVRLSFDELPGTIADALDLDHLSGDDLPTLNRMCQAIAPMGKAELEKLNAVVMMAEASGAVSICRLADNLDQFDFVSGVRSPEEYGRYMIQESGQFEYDANLDGFYDYRRFGEQRIQEEGGQFNEYGYVAYHGTLTLEELMAEDPAEQYRQEQGPQMGGLA